MKDSLRVLLSTFLALAALLRMPAALADGLRYEIATPDLGLAGAGWAARAQDGSTVFTNPAGLGWLGAPELTLGAQIVHEEGEFDLSEDAVFFNNNTRLGGSEGGNPFAGGPTGSIFLAWPLADGLAFGFGLVSPFGLAVDYGADWVGRYEVQDLRLETLTLLPALSWRPLEWLSLGAGLNAMAAEYKKTSAAYQFASYELADEAIGFGADLGVLVEPAPGTRLGLSYLSPVILDFEDRPDHGGVLLFGQLAPIPPDPARDTVRWRWTVPGLLTASVVHELFEALSVMASFAWQDWSTGDHEESFAGTLGVATGTEIVSTVRQHRTRDALHGAIGLQWRFAGAWRLDAGVALDGSPLKDSERPFSMPLGETWRFGLGLRWKADPACEVGLAYEAAFVRGVEFERRDPFMRSHVVGELRDAVLHYLASSVSWRW